MKRILLSTIGLLASIAPLTAQTLPTGVAFDVNLTEHSSSAVTGYKIYVVAGTNTLRVSDIGKPTPNGSTVNHINPSLFSGLAAGSYSVHTTAYGPGGESAPSNKASFSVSTSDPSVPSAPSNTEPIYDDPASGAAAVIAEAEHFDNGGQGVGYFDHSAGNHGGALRNTDVDIEATADAGGGHNVGWVSAGEWLNYTVDVGAAGSYELQLRVASPGEGGTFHIEVNGVDKTGPLQVPTTGGWQIWTTLRRNVTLEAGPQLWRIVMDEGSNGWVGNFNWIAAVPK